MEREIIVLLGKICSRSLQGHIIPLKEDTVNRLRVNWSGRVFGETVWEYFAMGTGHRAWGMGKYSWQLAAGSGQEEDMVKGRNGDAVRNPQIVKVVEVLEAVEED